MGNQVKHDPGRQASRRPIRLLSTAGGPPVVAPVVQRNIGVWLGLALIVVILGLLLTPGGGKWKLNLEEGQPVRIRLRGRDILARPELVGDVDEIERLLGVMTAANPRVSSFVAIPKGPDGQLDRARLETAVKYGFRVVRWHLDEPEASVP